MEIFFYIVALAMSIFSLIFTIILSCTNLETTFGTKEVIICLIFSIILIVVGLLTDKKYKE